MTTPGKPRQSAIPTPGRVTGIPTPGRSRSSSSVYQSYPTTPSDDISRAFADAIRANDPSQHRVVPLSASSSTSSSSLAPQSIALSGRRSVAGRPSSASSTSVANVRERAKTPTSGRTVSRPPSRLSDGSTRPAKTFTVGDSVRVESLGFEGTLRYLGEIEGKPDLWAGVELSGGFSGKGKNNGSVAGKQYFSCPDKCGIFVSLERLSPPTVGPGAVPRPSSVASSRGGRTTPAFSGRATPSFSSTSRTPSASYSNGRVTPSNGGRVTPSSTVGRTTPGFGLGRPTFKTPITKSKDNSLSEKITPGSRASKYVAMTAQQLSSRERDVGADSPTRMSTGGRAVMSSPTISRTLSSPSRPPGSPFATPKAMSGRVSAFGGTSSSPSLPSTRGRPSTNTPRARIPSGVAMPPPPSPKPSILQKTHTASDNASSFPNGPSSRPSSSASLRSTGTDELSLAEQLQSRLDALEYENERLRAAAETESKPESLVQLEQLELEKQQTLDKATDLEQRLSESQREVQSRSNQIQSLEAMNRDLVTQLDGVKVEAQLSTAAIEQQAIDHTTAMKLLEDQLEQHRLLDSEKEELIELQLSDISELKSSLEKAQADLEEEKKELGAQIDELRIAGQETIALYEERLSNANSQRYELEDRITSLEAGAIILPSSPTDQAAQPISFAAQIDNETLKDQVQHLQRKTAKLEEQLEDARAALERDVTAYQDRIGRIRQEEEQRKRDLLTKSKEVEQLLKSEAKARNRVEEIEEALRESTVALENARGEVESFRAELANLDLLIDDATEGDISSRLANFTKRAVTERLRFQKEVAQLEDLLRQSRNAVALQEANSTADAERIELNEQVSHLQARISEVMQTLETRTSELESLRKKTNRDAPITNGTGDSRGLSPKSETSIVREEVAGLKHIVQELQKENLAATQRIKFLESENELLSSEAEQLRQEVQILEENMNNSLLEGDPAIGSPHNTAADGDRMQRQAREQHLRFEKELDQTRKKLSETEMKHARIVHDLNKEISELETLVESKIYREDELEQEVERLKEKISRHKKSSKNAGDSLHRLSSASISTTNSEAPLIGKEEVCEICERPGHDIFNCSLLKDDVGMKEVFCEDCESPGHVAADCPNSQDVF